MAGIPRPWMGIREPVAPGPSPASRIHVPTERAVVDCAIYVDGMRVAGRHTHAKAIEDVRRTGEGFVWIGMLEPDEHQMADVAESFGIHELIVEDAVNGRQRPKLEAYEGTLVLNMATVDYKEHGPVTEASEIVSTGEVMVVIGSDYVLTVRHGGFTGLRDIRRALEAEPERLAVGPAAVMHTVADRVVDSYMDVAQHMERDVDELESLVFTPQTTVDIEQIYFVKRELLELKHNISPLALPLRRLSVDHMELVPREIRHYFRDVQDHHIRVAADVATLDEQLSSLVNAAVAIVGVQQNTDMRRISAWVAIAAVPTMIAGIYGMNFDEMPELHYRWGYHAVVAFMVVVCLGLAWLFRRNRWL